MILEICVKERLVNETMAPVNDVDVIVECFQTLLENNIFYELFSKIKYLNIIFV